MTTRIIGTGSYLPSTILTNEALSKIVETNDEWIQSRTGIKSRHIVKEETTTQLCTNAALKALEDANMKPEEVELIIVGTITADHVTPSAACEVQANIGAHKAVAFDINAACSGFMYALHSAHAFLQANLYENALIIGAESLSKIIDWEDRSTCILFGDGAGAVVVKRDEVGILAIDQGSDGEKGKVLTCKNRLNNNPFIQNSTSLEYVTMEGQEVYKFAVNSVPKSIKKVLEESQQSIEDIDYFLLHQANIRILQAVSKRLNIKEEKLPISIDHCGNVSAGSVPILLDELNKKGILKRGQKIILSGFGAGLTWGTTLLEW